MWGRLCRFGPKGKSGGPSGGGDKQDVGVTFPAQKKTISGNGFDENGRGGAPVNVRGKSFTNNDTTISLAHRKSSIVKILLKPTMGVEGRGVLR